MLISVDVGNVGLKYRRGGEWTVEPSLVRSVGPAGYTFVDGPSPRPLTYLGGPAGLPAQSVYVGSDAQRHGQGDLAIVGSAEARVRSAAYLLLHLYAILASLPAGVTEAAIAFAGGLPIGDSTNPVVAEALRARLKGTHTLIWGDTRFTITIERVLLVPQPIGAIATTLFFPDGKVRTNGALGRTRFVLDIGGGTTDYTGRLGLDLLPGTEGGIRIGVLDAARRSRELIQDRFTRFRHLTDAQIIGLLRDRQTDLSYQGDLVDVRGELDAGITQTAATILAEVLPRWERVIEQGEVLIVGGGGELMAGALSHEFAALTRVTLLPDPLFRVVDGIERLARHKLNY